MMTYEMVLAMAEALGDDATVFVEDGNIHVTLEDFGGFDYNWDEIEREYDDPDAVEDFEDMLEEKSLSQEGGFYRFFHFDGFTVTLGYASYEI